MDPEHHQLRHAWLTAARDKTIAAELEAVYTLIADQIDARAPRCDISGRCCHFEQHGHRLYVTGLEAAYTVSRLGLVGRNAHSDEDVAMARIRGDCPFLVNERCTVHPIRPLGCRVYFCDPTAQDWQQDLSERTLAMVRAIHEKHDVPYRYGEWRGMLELLVER
ncbi:MAG TPA: YkgJ family cysteine cluster protein [Phycisphaerales bacterium]|nr:YkgJ family cysteine cluster protein [Phycisphaerales bacterium]